MRFPFRNHKVIGPIIACIALNIAVPLARGQAVQFQLRNGDRVSGEILSETGLSLGQLFESSQRVAQHGAEIEASGWLI